VKVSVVIPCLNEEEGVGKAVDFAWTGIARAGCTGEVVVVDNGSTDRSAEIAAEHGATVVVEPRRGYGSAYLAGFAAARGEYIVIGDADGTYPFQDLGRFLARLDSGDDLVMGSRFKGTIHEGAMPVLNRYVGNRVITRTLRLTCGITVSDAYCGMRALRRDILPRLDLQSKGMEFALEMISKASRRGLRVSEVPIDYFVRTGTTKLNRFEDAARSFRFILLYSPSWLYMLPGAVMFAAGCLGMLAVVVPPIDAFGRSSQIHTLLYLVALILVGAQVLQLGVFARTYATTHLGEPDALVERFRGRVTLKHGLLAGGVLTLGGLTSLAVIASLWAYGGFDTLHYEWATAFGVAMLAVGVQVTFGSFFLCLVSAPAMVDASQPLDMAVLGTARNPAVPRAS